MLYATWKSETSRFAKPRSTELKAVDAAFERCGNSITGAVLQRKAIADALAAWITMQNRTGQWRQSMRNSTKGPNGKGTVEQLFDELAADVAVNQALRPFMPAVAVAPPVVPPTPSAPSYAPGQTVNARGPDGAWHSFNIQQQGNSCVCASILIVKVAYHPNAKGKLTEQMIRNTIAAKESGNLNSGVSLFDDRITKAHDWELRGTNPQKAIDALALQPFPLRGRLVTGGDKAMLEHLQACTPRRPSMVGWLWTKGGGHFTVCTGPAQGDNTKLVIVDPQVGFKTVSNDIAGLSSYVPLPGVQGKVGDIVACSP